MNIPELKEAFTAMEVETHALLKKGLPDAEAVKELQKVWKSIFHRSISAEAAKSYLEIKRSKRGKKTRRQKGGAVPLAGAPLDYTTRPGIDGTYVSVPAYQVQGLAAYDKFNQEGMVQECGTKDFTPVVPADIGSNEVM